MYTLRKVHSEGAEKGRITNVYLGRYYTLDRNPQENNPDLNKEVKMMVTGEFESHYISEEDGFSCIMTESGQTFEVLNKN